MTKMEIFWVLVQTSNYRGNKMATYEIENEIVSFQAVCSYFETDCFCNEYEDDEEGGND